MRKSDHDLLLEVHQAIYEKETGLKAQVISIREDLQGNGKVGLVSRVQNIENRHAVDEKKHKEFRWRIYILIGILVPFLTVLFNQLINWKRGS